MVQRLKDYQTAGWTVVESDGVAAADRRPQAELQSSLQPPKTRWRTRFLRGRSSSEGIHLVTVHPPNGMGEPKVLIVSDSDEIVGMQG